MTFLHKNPSHILSIIHKTLGSIQNFEAIIKLTSSQELNLKLFKYEKCQAEYFCSQLLLVILIISYTKQYTKLTQQML